MSAKRPITIIGGGLAGLTLGIGLRQRSIPVTVWEAGHYPRHRVCGEFISGRGQETLARLGLRERLVAAGAIPARTTAFFSPRASSPVRELPEPALSISRHALDALLAEEFRRLGGDLREAERWRGEEYSEGMVRATGRRLQPVVDGWRWFGLKVHARNVPLAADLEMHLSASGYVGISRLQNGEVNICGLFRRFTSAADAPLPWLETLRGAPGSLRYERLANAVFDENSFCSVAGLSLAPQRASVSKECCVGDTLTMIPPVTGNGMSMAFESAELAAAPLAAYSSGEMTWTEAQQLIARQCDERFMRRLAWARMLQRLMFMSRLQNTLVPLVPRWQWLWRLLLARTR
ncbi:MAG: putative electron transfer oxidoreductase [Pedosphaera sp.]|nr:putative electron transfer oxidoreductase [Pedosphaera sp.]